MRQPASWHFNTQPVLVMRFEARTEKRLAEIRAPIEGKVKKYA